MIQLDIEEIRKIEIELLNHFKIFCREKGIQFFLSNGTLLGAIKYRGFIPWDDDIDVFVPRKDYERLLIEFEDTEIYKLFSIERVHKFRFPFAKLCDMRTFKDESGVNNGISLGIDIDIFPLDYFPNDFEQAKKQINKTKREILYLYYAKINYGPGKNIAKTLIKNILIFIARCVSAKRMIMKIERIADNDGKYARSQFRGCAVWPMYNEREIVSSTIFEKEIEVEFEGEIFPAPIGYDEYLRSLYGDYKLDPPIEKQKSHHTFKAYKINNN